MNDQQSNVWEIVVQPIGNLGRNTEVRVMEILLPSEIKTELEAALYINRERLVDCRVISAVRRTPLTVEEVREALQVEGVSPDSVLHKTVIRLLELTERYDKELFILKRRVNNLEKA